MTEASSKFTDRAQLEAFLRASSRQQALERLSEHSEKERKQLNSVVQTLWTEASKHSNTWEDVSAAYMDNIRAAILFCCDLTFVKKAGLQAQLMPLETIFILSARKPAWLSKWCEYVLKVVPELHFFTVIHLEKTGTATLQHSPPYYQQLALYLPYTGRTTEEIKEIPGLLAEFADFIAEPMVTKAISEPGDVLRSLAVSRVRNGNFGMAHHAISLAKSAYDNGVLVKLDRSQIEKLERSDLDQLWVDCIKALLAENLIDRNRLQNFSFQLLHEVGEIPHNLNTTWSFGRYATRLNDGLIVSKGEHLSQYVPLIGAANARVASYALKIISAVDISQLDKDQLCDALPSTFRQKDKDNALAALHIIERCLASENLSSSENDQKYLSVLLDAFYHKTKAVTARALKIVTDNSVLKKLLRENSALASKARSLSENLEGTARSTVLALTASTGGKPSSSRSATLDSETALARIAAARKSLSANTPYDFDRIRDWAGLSADLQLQNLSPGQAALFATQEIQIDSTLMPVLHLANRIPAITSAEEILFQASAALAGRLSTMDIEGLLSAMALNKADNSPEFREKTRTLEERLDTIGSNFPTPLSAFKLVVSTWLTGKPSTETYLEPSPLNARCAGLALRLAEGLVLPMLATTTHKAGWLDPLVLVERIKQYQKHDRLIGTITGQSVLTSPASMREWFDDKSKNVFYADALEFIQALLRMAPDNRHAALTEASDIAGDCGKVLRYALGGEVPADVKSKSFLLAAFRARYPEGICPFEFDKVATKEEDVVYPAVYEYDERAFINYENDRYRILARQLPDLLRSTRQPNPLVINSQYINHEFEALQFNEAMDKMRRFELYPTVSIHSNLRDWYPSDYYHCMWMQNREPMLARMCKILLANLKSTVSTWAEDYSILLYPDVALGRNGCWWFALALIAQNDEIRQTALDILIAAIYQQRVNASTLASCFSKLNRPSPIRLSKGLRELSRVSDLHALFVWQVLEQYLLKKEANIELNYLELMLELEDEKKFLVSEESRALLKRLSGGGKPSSKSEKAASKLSAAPQQWTDLSALNAAFLLSIEARLERIKSWQNTEGADRQPAI